LRGFKEKTTLTDNAKRDAQREIAKPYRTAPVQKEKQERGRSKKVGGDSRIVVKLYQSLVAVGAF